ncbi:hsp70-binding protein 1-like protein [Aphelenchoides avenae]|nr:hsp70-binding protein 1-like protein [Aphelenchus avenae]
MSDPSVPGNDGSYKKLLQIATAAKGDEPWDPNVKPMPEEDRKWLEGALQELASDTDPIKQMKKIMSQLDTFQEPKPEDVEPVGQIVEDLIDLVCHIDIAVDFCKLGGLHLIHRFLSSDIEKIRIEGAKLVSFIAQNNPSVQDYVLKTNFLERFLLAVADPTISEAYRIKSLGAISAVVRAHFPGIQKFLEVHGLETMQKAFDTALENGRENTVHRCVTVLSNISINVGQTVTADKIQPTLKAFREKLAQKGDAYQESIEYIDSVLNNA